MQQHEIALQYLGKKAPLKLNIPILKTRPILFGAKDPTWVIASDAKWLMKTNPSMFMVVDERGKEEIEDAAAIIAKKKEADKEEAEEDEALGIDNDVDEADKFEEMTRKQIADQSLEKFGIEIKIGGKTLQAVKDAYDENEKAYLTEL